MHKEFEAYSFFLWESLTFGRNLVRQLIKYYLKGMWLSRLQIAFNIGKDWHVFTFWFKTGHREVMCIIILAKQKNKEERMYILYNIY